MSKVQQESFVANNMMRLRWEGMCEVRMLTMFDHSDLVDSGIKNVKKRVDNHDTSMCERL